MYSSFELPTFLGGTSARLAARASRCAAEQSAFKGLHDALYQGQDSIGLLPFREFARRGAVPDLEAFDRCAADTRSDTSIDLDVALVSELEGKGTPTVIVDGLLFRHTPSIKAVDSLMRIKVGG